MEETMKNANSATGNNARVALRLTQAVMGTDDQLRAVDPALGIEMLGQKVLPAQGGLTETSIGVSGVARGQQTPDQRNFQPPEAGK
jgi:hypothetical protein